MHSYSLIKEMHETIEIIRSFDSSRVAPWIELIHKKNKLFLTGEGSSRIFPAKNIIARALQHNCPWFIHTSGARQAAEYDLSDYCVIGASNSGQTIELIELFKSIHTIKLGLTAYPDTPLHACADSILVLKSGKEQATAASKTVVEQALTYQSLLQGNEWQDQEKAADLCSAILHTTLSDEVISIISNASTLYFAGRDNGVAEELTLKTNEIIRKKSDYLEGTYAVHGIEEVMQADEVLIVIDPFPSEIVKLQHVIATNIGMKIIAISNYDTPFITIPIPQLQGFDTYFQLLAGWNILVQTGLSLGINMDQPIRARKIGNAI
jgi:glucosamine--fructose-6-phosphate aminotransferase (isomerizing)